KEAADHFHGFGTTEAKVQVRKVVRCERLMSHEQLVAQCRQRGLGGWAGALQRAESRVTALRLGQRGSQRIDSGLLLARYADQSARSHEALVIGAVGHHAPED